jgi:phosphoglycerate dehydrogenase-like enzyme
VISSNSFKFVMLPPQNDTTRAWARRLAEAVPEVRVVVAEDADSARREIADADAAFGALGKELLSKATKLRWLQAPFAAPPAGYYYPELINHRVNVTNFREIYNDHIGAHILAFVLAFARGLHVYIPQQLRREWKKSPLETGDVVHLPEATALIVGVGGIGAEAARRGDGAPSAKGTGEAAAARRFRDSDGAAYARDRRLLQPRPLPAHEADGFLHQHRPRHDDQAG